MTEPVNEYQKRRDAERKARMKAARKRRRKEALMNAALKATYFALGAVLFIAFVLLIAFAFKALAWNLGVVGLVSACGGTVAKINLATAVGAVFLFGALGQVLSGGGLANFNYTRE